MIQQIPNEGETSSNLQPPPLLDTGTRLEEKVSTGVKVIGRQSIRTRGKVSVGFRGRMLLVTRRDKGEYVHQITTILTGVVQRIKRSDTRIKINCLHHS